MSFDDSKPVFRIRKSKKDRQYKGQMKRTNNGSTRHCTETKDRTSRTPLKTEGELTCSERVSSSCFTCGTRREIWHFLVFVLLFFVYFVLFLHPFKLLLLELTFPTTTVMGNTSEAERDNSVPLGYIIICSIGGVLWAVILLLLCLCICRADKLAHSMRSVACNTTFTNVTEDSKNDGAKLSPETQDFVENSDDISFANIELVLDINQLTIIKDKCETKL